MTDGDPRKTLHSKLLSLKNFVSQALCQIESLGEAEEVEAAEEPDHLRAFLPPELREEGIKSWAAVRFDVYRAALELEHTQQLNPIWKSMVVAGERLQMVLAVLTHEDEVLLRHYAACTGISRGDSLLTALRALDRTLLSLPHDSTAPEPLLLSQDEIAERLGVTKDTVRGWTRRKNNRLEIVEHRGKKPLYDFHEATKISARKG